MELKKIMALAMIVFMAIPNLTIVSGADPDEDLACAIERARLYLDKVRNLADNMAEEYSADPDHMIHGYLDEIYDLIDQDYEDPSAMYYLDQASTYLGTGDFNLTARNLAAARNIRGRVKGLLNSMVKVHKVARTEMFMEQVRHRIDGIVDKIDKLRGRLGEGKANKAKASMGLALGNMPQIGDNPSDGDVNEAIDNLEDTIEEINEALGTLNGDILEAMDRLEAKIRVLNASAERLSGRGYDTDAVVDDLENAEALLEEILGLPVEGGTDEAEGLLEDAEVFVSEANAKIREIRKEHQNKGSKGNGRG